MDDLVTPYEDDSATEFINCSVCEISLRGQNLYKIHVTTPRHLKKEDAAIAAGVMSREKYLPKFQDILEYIDYLNLDEPIIGLNFLEEIPGGRAEDHNILYYTFRHTQLAHRYRCTLCNNSGSSPEMIHHVIGRKHRQKYIETQRPDLVIWETNSLFAQTGKLIRNRAEIVARQDGSGRPTPMKTNKKGEKSPIKDPEWPRNDKEPPNPSSTRKQNQDFQGSHFHDSGLNLESTASFLPTRSSSLKMADSRKTTNLYDQQLEGHDNWERGLHQGKNMDSDHFLDNSYTPSICNPSKETQWKWKRPTESYGTEREPETNNKLFSEDVRLQFQPQRSDIHGNEQHWSSHMDPNPRLGSSKAQSPTKNVHPPNCDFIDYHHGMRKAETLSLGSKKSHSPPEDSCSDFKIPESFRRFMNPRNETSFNRKRKSRFSDATPEEVEVAQRVFNTGPPGAKLRSAMRSGNEMVQQGSRGGMLYSDQFSQSKMTSKHGKRLQDDSIYRSVDNIRGEEHNNRERNWTNTRDAQEVYKQGHREARDLIRNRYDKTGGQEEMYSPHRLDEQVLQSNRFKRSTQEPEWFQRGAQEMDRFQRGTQDGDRFQRGAQDGDRFQRGAQDGDRFQRGSRDGDRFQRGTQDGDRFQRGTQDGDRFQRGTQDGDRFQRSSKDGDRFQRSSKDGDRFQRGAQDGDRFQRGAQKPNRFQAGAEPSKRSEGRAQQRFQEGDMQTGSPGISNSHLPPLDVAIDPNDENHHVKKLEKLKSTILQFMARN
ncbi:uncharacterized protein LOC144214719 isoform X2 [Stigmatopora nigra]